jgi:hypothetical protein
MTETFEIITPRGVTVRTFDTAEAARRYVMAHKLDLPGLAIERVTITTTREAVYTPRKRIAA